ncbi:uncharacterized protein LOC113232114 isoform X2 [Hyposmocoma kahamanoa]|nr:uncharacterized protein LOC113232114 isoform X2 [Hyposmocoma kahamanoa]
MYQQVIISIFMLRLSLSTSNFLEIDSNYQKPKLERNSVLNKGVWVKSIKENDKSTANFLFRGNPVDVDNQLQNDFNPFEDGNGPSSPFISSYVERAKRSLDHKRLRRFRKSLTNCSKRDCNLNTVIDEKPSLIKSQLLTKLKPASVFNDYPYEIALLLGNNKGMLEKAKNYSSYVINEMIRDDNKTIIPITETNTNYTNGDIVTKVSDEKTDKVNYTINYTVNSNNVPKRSMAVALEDSVKRIGLGDFNNSNALSDDIIHSEIVAGEIGRIPSRIHVDRDIFDKDDKVWRQNAPLPNSPLPNMNRIKSKEEESKVVRPVTERGLVKVLSMLTKTFKKIMKQHSDIKDIHRKLSHTNENFLENIHVMTKKFEDFDNKYNNLVKLSERMKNLETKLSAKEQHYKAKERELSKNLVDFEIQQKKFLQQQRQFYNIQKLMLAQNERINSKQNAIAKTQSEISHRQNNFARILKKAKQIYVDNKYVPSNPKLPYSKAFSNEVIERNRSTETNAVIYTTTITPKSTESIKINLFSIPSLAKLKNQDQLLLDEKDEQSVDDLIYKYYFNNTLLDNLMKHFLSNFLGSPDGTDLSRNNKAKRDDTKMKLNEISSTILLPMNKSENVELVGKTLNRERRWISHHSRRKWRTKNRGKKATEIVNTDDEKTNKKNAIDLEVPKKEDKPQEKPRDAKELIQLHKNDVFITMATNFCNGIGQNQNGQILDWCVEKALRKLQNIDIKIPPPISPSGALALSSKGFKPRRLFQAIINTKPRSLKSPQGSMPLSLVTKSMTAEPASVTMAPQLTITNTVITSTGFFPDNDKLESNLSKYELIKDTEGNVYYDGSLHASDIIKEDKNSDDSDIMPGLESNSRIDTIDPETFDTKAMRRAMIRRMRYENMFKKMSKL